MQHYKNENRAHELGEKISKNLYPEHKEYLQINSTKTIQFKIRSCDLNIVKNN